MSKEIALFDARFTVPTRVTSTGSRFGEPRASLTFPDTQTAADFINRGLANSRYPGSPVTVEYLEEVREAPTGDNNEYDAFVSRPNRETGDVAMQLRRHGGHELPAHAALSEFVLATVQRMAHAEQS